MTTTSPTELSQRIQSYSPEQCAELVTRPSSEVYYALKQKIQASPSPWIQAFLDEGGLRRLLDTLVLLSQNGQKEPWTSVCDAILQLDCIGCVRELVNFREGMEALLVDTELVNKLTLALDTSNVYPKKQIFELLTCVAIATKSGHSSVLGGLENYQKVKHQAHRFTVILHEMKLCENSHYRSTLLGFINALLQCSTDLRQRCRFRNELIGLKILDVINFMKKDEKEPDFCVQMKVFYESKQRDDIELSETYSMDFQDPRSIFEAINNSMVGTTELTSFLHIFQDLYRMDTTSCDRLLLWQTLAKVTYALSNVSCDREAQHLLTKIYIALDSGIANPHEPSPAERNAADKPTVRGSDAIKPLTEQDIMAEVLSCSPDFHNPSRHKELMFPSGDDGDSNIDNDNGEENDRRDSGISLKSNNASPPLPAGYSDYDNVIETVPTSDIFLLQQQNPNMLTRHFSKDRHLLLNHHHHQYCRNQHLPAIQETDLDCVENEADGRRLESSEENNFKKSAYDNDSSVREEVSGKLLRPESLEVVAQVAKKDTVLNVVDRGSHNGVTTSRPRSYLNGRVEGHDTGSEKMIPSSSLLKQLMQKRLTESGGSGTSLLSADRACSMKTVKWVKVQDDKVKDPLCMWRLMHDFGSKILPIDYSRLERDFCTKEAAKQDINEEVSLLHPDVSLSLSLFLSRLETHPEFVAQCVRDLELYELGVEAVRHLVAILPTDEEIRQLDVFLSQGGSIYDLGAPEQLLLSLSAIPAFRLHLSAYVFASDFDTKYRRLRDAFAAIVRTCNDVIQCERLRDFMRCALRVGNYLNKDTHLGKVDGVSLSTWHRLGQVKCNGSHANLLSWLIKYISDSEDPTLFFLSELPTLEKAASCDIEEMKSEVLELNTQLKKFVGQFNLAPKNSQGHFSAVMETVTQDLERLHSDLQMTKQSSHQLMVYLCEEESQFDIQNCLRTLHSFISLVTRLREENSDRQIERQLAGRRVKQMIDQQIDNYFQDIFTDQDISLSPSGKKRPGLVEHLLSKLQKGEVERDYLEGGMAGTDYKHLHSFVLPEHDSQRFSPDRGLSPVVPSHSTPSKPDESVLVIPELKELGAKKTYSERADTYIKNQYRKDNQVLSASFTKQDNHSKVPQASHDDHSPDTGTKPFPLETSPGQSTKPSFPIDNRPHDNSRPFPGGGVSQYENVLDIDDIMMNVQTYEQKNRQAQSRARSEENGKGISTNQRAGKFTVDPDTKMENAERYKVDRPSQVVTERTSNTDASGKKFFFGLDGRTEEKDLKMKREQEEVVREMGDVVARVADVKHQKEKPETTNPLHQQPNTTASQRPASKLGLLKRFSKAILRQQDGNVQTVEGGEKQARKSGSVAVDNHRDPHPSSAPVRSKSLPMPRKGPQMGTAASGGMKYPAKNQRTTVAANDKENRHVSNNTNQQPKPVSKSIKTSLFRRQPRLEKSSSSAQVDQKVPPSMRILKGKVPLQKSSSAPVVEGETRVVLNAHVIAVIEDVENEERTTSGIQEEEIINEMAVEPRCTSSQGGDGMESNRNGHNNNTTVATISTSTATRSSGIPAFSRRNALPTRDKNNAHGTNGATVAAVRSGDKMLQEEQQRCMEESQKTRTLPTYRDREITVKPSYGVHRDEELKDRVIESKNIKYNTSTMPPVNSIKVGNAKSQITGNSRDKEPKIDRKYGNTLPSNNRFGFGWKERKTIHGMNENRASESGVIPTAPKHEIQQANQCTLKIYRKYSMQ